MATQVRTLTFLPEIFQTEINSQFLGSTLDILTSAPDLKRVNGLIGQKHGYGISGNDKYVVEPTTERTNYQLEPSVTFLKQDTNVAQDFIDYPGIINELTHQGGATQNHNKLFANEFYTWDSFTNLDKSVNYSMYYWLPLGPDAIIVADGLDISDIEGKVNFTTPSGLQFINGLKVIFSNITPVSNVNVEFYVEGVGTAIKLVPVDELLCTEVTGGGIYTPFDKNNYDTDVWSIKLYIPIQPDYITISRASADRNPWSRANRWFHQRVLDTTQEWNGQVTKNPSNIITRAQRPIVEFDADMRLYNSGTKSAGMVDYIDTYTTNAETAISGALLGTATIAVTLGRTTSVVNGKYQLDSVSELTVDQEIVFRETPGVGTKYVANIDANGNETQADYAILGNAKLNKKYYIKTIDRDLKQITVTDLSGAVYPKTSTGSSIVIPSMTLTSSATVQSSAKVIFAVDKNPAVRKKVFNITYTGTEATAVAVMSEVGTVRVEDNVQVHVSDGPGNLNGTSWRFMAGEWVLNQQKEAINQAPLFDIFDTNENSLGDTSYYSGTTFKGSKVYSYQPGVGTNDGVLGFPVAYSSGSGGADYLFDINLNSDTFSYLLNGVRTTKNISMGFVQKLQDYTTATYYTGWVKAAAPSKQYQQYEFTATDLSQTDGFVCDILSNTREEVVWSPVVVHQNGSFIQPNNISVTRDTTLNKTTVNLLNTTITAGDSISVSVLSDQVSPTAFYKIPDNLQNNPFNSSLASIALGEVKQHYLSIYNNAPGTSGAQLGNNNYADLGNINGYGNRIIHSSASLVLPGVFLRKPEFNLQDSLRYSAEKYQDYKSTLTTLALESDYSVYQTPSQILDDVIARLTANKTPADSFFWSDMLPSGGVYATNSYEYRTGSVNTVVPLSRVYDYENANYNCVYVYYETTINGRATSELLLHKTDYVIDANQPIITMIRPVEAGARIVVKEYNQTFGSYCPSTPTKLGLFPATTPRIITDTSYQYPQSFIVGHDGSYTKLYGRFTDGVFSDFRDLVLFEFEKRVYNNIKVGGKIPLVADEVMPGQWRKTAYSYDEVQALYRTKFLDWAGKYRINYRTQHYAKADPFSYNYNKSGNIIDDSVIVQGHWRGIYLWFYDTVNPAQYPWEMLGLVDKPLWWDSRYGLAPYTSGNTLMWQDIADGVIWNNGDSITVESRRRHGLLSVLPVDAEGKLLPPNLTVVGNYDNNTFKRDWKAGDGSPAEAAYLKSSTWPFDLMGILSVFEPVKFYNYFADRDAYKYSDALEQFVFNERYHLDPRQLTIYGTDETTAKHSYMNWVVDYASRSGASGASKLAVVLKNLDVRLSYRLAGFSDKQYLKFFTENSTPSATSANLLIPDDSFDLMLYDNIPSSRISYSSVIVQKTSEGYTVWGNNLVSPHFSITTPLEGPTETITKDTATVNVARLYDAKNLTKVAYGTQYYTTSGVSEFLINYGRALEQSGVTFEQIKSGKTLNWKYMVAEFLYWAQQSWEVGSTINLNPAATAFTAYKDGLIVQPLTIAEDNFVLNQNLFPIPATNISVVRNNQSFGINVLSEQDTIAYTNLNMSAIEHAIVFNNETLFGDVIYNPQTGMRQARIILNGSLTAEWNGGVTATGFILNEGQVEEWNSYSKYPKGQIVQYKNLYWSAQQQVEPTGEFDYTKWKQSSYEEVKTGLLPNPNTSALQSDNLYNINRANLDTDMDLLAFGLIGYKPRAYMSESQMSDIAQINAYRNMIRNKGTLQGAMAFKGATMTQGSLDYSIHENWAIKRGEFGGVLNSNYVEALLDGNLITGNPGIIGFGDGTSAVAGAHQTITVNPYSLKGSKNYVNDLINYGRAPKDNKFLPASTVVTSQQNGLPSAGYVNINDVKFAAYSLDDLNLNPDAVSDTYRDDMVWLANHRGEWDVFTPVSLESTVSQVTNNFDGTVTVKFSAPHKLAQYDIVYIIQFDDRINGFYLVDTILSANEIILAISLDKTEAIIKGTGISFKLMSRRVSATTTLSDRSEIIKYGQFSTHRSWIDQSITGEWQVLANGPVYKNSDTKSPEKTGVANYGISVAYTSDLGYLVVDGVGNIYQNGVKIANKVAGSGAGTKLFAFGKFVYCSSPGEGLMYSYDFTGNAYGASIIKKGVYYTIDTIGTTDYINLGAPARWANGVQVKFTPETDTLPAYMIVFNANGYAIEDDAYLSGADVVKGTYVVQQTHIKVDGIVAHINATQNEKYNLGKKDKQTIAMTASTGIKVGDLVYCKYFPFGTKVKSINTSINSITFDARLTEDALDTSADFTFYRPVSETTLPADLQGTGVYRVSEATPLTTTMTTTVDPSSATITVKAQPVKGTSFKATKDASGINIDSGNATGYLGGTGFGTWSVVNGVKTFTMAASSGYRYDGGTGTVKLEYSSFSIGSTTGEFAVSQDRSWLYVANTSGKIDTYMLDVDTYRLVDVETNTVSISNTAVLATNRDGSKLIIGEPNETVAGSANAGAAYIYARATENFLQSDTASKVVPDQYYSITDMGGTDASSLSQWFMMGAGIRFRARIKKDYTDASESGYIMTVGDISGGTNPYGIQNVKGKGNNLRIQIGSYLSGHDSVHSVGLYSNDIKTGTQVLEQFDSHETAVATLSCAGYTGSSELKLYAAATPLDIDVGLLVRMNTVTNTTTVDDYMGELGTTDKMRYIPQNTYITYIGGNDDYSNAATYVASPVTTYNRNTIVEYGGKIYKCIVNSTTSVPTTTAAWAPQFITIGLSNPLASDVGSLGKINNEYTPASPIISDALVTFKPAGLSGRYVVSKEHNFAGSTRNGFNGSYVLAVKPGVEFKALGYGSYVAPLGAGNEPQYDSTGKKLLVISKAGYVTLRKSFIISGDIPSALINNGKTIVKTPLASVYVDNKLVPFFTMVERNGSVFKSYNYTITVDEVTNKSTITFVRTPPLGSVVVVEYGQLQLQQRTQSANPRIGALYGRSVATNNWGAEVFVGAPYESSTVGTKHNVEGTVYRWTNGGQRYNSVTLDLGSIAPDSGGKYDLVADLYVDGFLINLNIADEKTLDNLAQRVATIIDTTEPTNVDSTVIKQYTDAKGVKHGPFVTIRNGIPGTTNDQVDITTSAHSALGLTLYTKTQNLYEYNLSSTGAYGYTVAVNQELNSTRDSLVVSAPNLTAIDETTFDFIDDQRADDTIFDNGGTLFVDQFKETGVVYQYDYLQSTSNSLSNPGLYTYGQYVNIDIINDLTTAADDIAISPKYGQVLAFNEGRIIVGSPNWYKNGTGRVSAFANDTYESSWHVDKQPPQKVDVHRLRAISVYDTLTNTTLDNLDYIDPAQGKMLAVVQQNVDFISNSDPANYDTGIMWGEDRVGSVWMDTTNFRLMNYNQPDAQYNARYFGQAFPGSTAEIYTWVKSSVEPVDYNGSGYVTTLDKFTTTVKYDKQADKLVNTYYFWVKNYGEVPHGKTLAPSTLTRYVLNPLDSGIPFLGAMSIDTVGLFNCKELIRENTSALHLGYSESKSTDYAHSDWLLVKTDDANSFLPGVPVRLADAPSSLYLKYLTSFMGKEIDLITQEVRPTLDVPDANLSVLVRYGVSFRPRQTMFEDRELALKNMVQYANRVLATIPATETCGTFFLNKGDTSAYWTLTDWWATGYSSSTKAAVEVNTYNELSVIGSSDVLNAGSTGIVATLSEGMAVRVKKNGQGLAETYVYTAAAGWTRVGLENGTIALLDTLYTTQPAPAQEIYWILRWIHEQVFVGDNAIEKNNSLMMMFNFIQSNSPQQQNYLPWLNKTSMIDIDHTIRQLLPYKKYQIQSSTLINGFINEIKPFHVFVKEFSYKYSGIEYFDGNITDFDLPAKFRSSTSKFTSPVLKNKGTTALGEYLSSNDIWSESDYSNWFKHYGLSVTNSGNTVAKVTTLAKTPTSNDDYFYLESVAAMPIAGSVYVGTELVMYTKIDRLLNRIGGLTKTTGETHVAGETISLITTPVMVMDAGRAYTGAPTITAHIDTDTYPESPRREASFMVTMNGEGISAVTVVDAGDGYPQTPELRVSPSSIVGEVSAGQVDTVINEIALEDHEFITGDSVMWITESTLDTGLRNYGTYYVSALNGGSIALYENYRDAIEGYTGMNPVVTGTADRVNNTSHTHFHIKSPFESDTPVFTTGDQVKVRFNSPAQSGIVTYSAAFDYYFIRVDEAADTNATTANVYDYVSLHTTYQDALSGSNPVSFQATGNASYLQGNTYLAINKVARTDNSRVNIKARADGSVAVVARVQSFFNNGMVRGLKTGMKFDRVTYNTSVINWEEGVNRFQESGWDTTTWNPGEVYYKGDMVVYNNTLYRCVKDTLPDWEVLPRNQYEGTTVTQQWARGKTYAKGEIVIYNSIVYQALMETSSGPTDFTVDTFSLANWSEVESSDPLLTAADRTVGFYRPDIGMPGYTFGDLSQLMSGTKYPYQTIMNPQFDWGSTYAFVPRNVDTGDNTITLNYVKPTMAGYQEVVYGADTVSDTVFTSYTPAVTQTSQIGNAVSLTVVDNYSLFRGQPISFLGKMIANNYTVVDSDQDKKISSVVKVSENDTVITKSLVGETVTTEVIRGDRVYYVADIQQSASAITVAYTSNLAQIQSDTLNTTVTQITGGNTITLSTSLGSNWLGATVVFTSNPLFKIDPTTYFVSSINGSNITIARTIDSALAGEYETFTPANKTGGNMGVSISPTVPMANAMGFTTVSFVNRTKATKIIANNPETAPMVEFTNIGEVYDNAAIKFGGLSVGGLNTDKVYFIDGVHTDVANSRLAFKTHPTTPVPDTALWATLTDIACDLNVTLNMPYAQVSTMGTGTPNAKVKLASAPIIKTDSGNLTIASFSNKAGFHFTQPLANGVTTTDQFYVANANTTALTFDILRSDGVQVITTGAPSSNQYVVFNPYLNPVESSFITGEQVKLYYEDPQPEITSFYYVDRVGNTTISLHTTSSDARLGTNAVAITGRNVYGFLGKPQTVMQTAGPIQGVTGDIIPMTYEHTNPSLGFGLIDTKTYWAKFVSTSTVVLYKTYTDAVNDFNRVPLLKQTGGQFTVGKPVKVDVPQADGSTKVEIVEYNSYDSIIISDNDVEANVVVAGNQFEYGYGPEELMPGVMLDGVNFTVTTRPGATWDPLDEVSGVNSGSAISEKYAHTGFNMVRFTGKIGGSTVDNWLELPNDLTFINSISFDGRVANPAVVEVYGGASVTKRTKWAEGVDYTIDWINKVITVVDTTHATNTVNAIANGVEVVVYEFGNGNQLLRGTSDRYPLRTNTTSNTDYSEILLDVPYEHIDVPGKDNFWLSVTVFVNGKKVEYYDGNRPGYNASEAMFSIVPQRPFDPISDPYNPSKIVFTTSYDLTTTFASFAITSNVLGLYQVLNVADTYQVPMTDNLLSYFPGKVGVWVNGVRKTMNDDYTLSPTLTNGGSKDQLLTITFVDGVVALHDTVKITYGNDGLSIPTTQYDITGAAATGGMTYNLTNFLGDNNYMPFADLRVIYDDSASTTALKNTWQARSTVDLYDGMAIIVTGDDTNAVIGGYPVRTASNTNDVLSRIYYLRDVVFNSDNTLFAGKDTFGLYTFKLSNSPGGTPIVTSLGTATPPNGVPTGLTFTAEDNLIVEVNGIRYNGTAPDLMIYGGTKKPINNNLSLVYPIPVYSLSTYDTDFVSVKVNGISYLASNNYVGSGTDPITNTVRTIKWATNYDPITNQFAGMDSLLPAGYTAADTPEAGYFDDGSGFDNNNTVAVVFSYDGTGQTGLSPADTVTVQYIVTGENWAPATTYNAGDLVSQDGVTYRCLVSGTTNQPPHADWSSISLSPPPIYLINVKQDIIRQYNDWSSASAYAVGAKVFYDNKVYEALLASNSAAPVVPGAPTSTLTWQEVTNWTSQGGWTSETKDESVIGGTMTLYLPNLTTDDVVNVTSFGRTSQQSLKTQLMTDIIATQVTNITEYNNSATVLTAVDHGFSAGDKIFVTGGACPNIDGGQYYVDAVDADTLELYRDKSLTVPVTKGPSTVSFITLMAGGLTTFVQLAVTHSNAPGIKPNPAVIDQPDYNLIDSSRLFVSFTENVADIDNTNRYYVAQEKFKIVQTDYVDSDGNLATVNSLVLLTPVVGDNTITVTSMVPTASPSETRYRINATWDNNGKPQLPFEYKNDPNSKVYFESIYREPIASRTYVSALGSDNTTLTVANPYALVDIIEFTDLDVKTDPETGAIYTLIGGLDANEIAQINAFDTTGSPIDGYYWVAGSSRSTIKVVFEYNPSVIVSTNPTVVYENKVNVTVAVGNKMIINGEQIRYTGIELSAKNGNYGKITGIRHATNVSSAALIKQYDSVQSLLPSNLLSSSQYIKDWYSNRVTTYVEASNGDNDITNGTYVFSGATNRNLSQVKVGDNISFAPKGGAFEDVAHLYTGDMAISDAYVDNGTFLEFRISSYTQEVYFTRAKPTNNITTAIDETNAVINVNTLNKRGYNNIIIHNATGMKIGDTVNCGAIPYSIQEDTKITNIQDVDSTDPKATKIVTLSRNLMKDIPQGTGIQSSQASDTTEVQPHIAPNAAQAKVGEKIQLKTAAGKLIEYVSPVTGDKVYMFTIVSSTVSPTDPQKWLVKIAETLPVLDTAKPARACVTLTEYAISAIVKGTPWKLGVNYSLGDLVTDTNGVSWKCTVAHLSGDDNIPAYGRVWAPGTYTVTIAPVADGQYGAWEAYQALPPDTPAQRHSYPSISPATGVTVILETMSLPLQLDTGVNAEFLKQSV